MKLLTNKQIKQAILRIAANHIIAVDALYRTSSLMSIQQYADAMQRLVDNSVESAKIVGGLKGINTLNEIVSNAMRTMSVRCAKE